MATKTQEQVNTLRGAMREMEGVMYVLEALADMRGEETNALRNQVRNLDHAFAEVERVADELEHGQNTEGGGKC